MTGQFRDPAEDGLQVTFIQLHPAELGEGHKRVECYSGDDGSSALGHRQGICQLSMWRYKGRHPSRGTPHERDSGRDPRRAVHTGAGSLPPGGGSHRTPGYPLQSRNG